MLFSSIEGLLESGVIDHNMSTLGLAAIQLATAVGARPIATTRNASKVQALRDAGAKDVINTKDLNLIKEVQRLTGGKGAEIIFDPVVGAQFGELCGAAAQNAEIFAYGALGSGPSPFPLFIGLAKCLTFRTYSPAMITSFPERLLRAKEWILPRLGDGQLKPVIAKIFSFRQMTEAHRYMESNDQVGKIVVIRGSLQEV